PSQHTRRRRRPRLFTKDIETLLYSMGDGPVSLDSTVNCLEDCLVEFLTDISHESLQFARLHGRLRIKVDDVPFALRNDPLKLGRMNYIREQLAKIEKAKKLYDTNNVNEREYFADEDDEDDDNDGSRPLKKAKKKER
ncbi:TFIID-18kDa-domain-containing protein, partial [Metschnikowia bicuspidata var. bicuspidata NRRL YB-4993]